VLTVAVDATPLLGTPTGIGVAVRGMVRHLSGRSDLSTVGYGLTGRGRRQLPAALPPGTRAATVPMPAGPLLRLWERWNGPPVEWWTGPVDVVHGTNFVVPPTRRAGRLVSVWDLTPVHFPELVRPTARRYPRLIARALGEGTWVHTGSASVAAEIVEHFGVDAARVRVVPPGVDVPAEVPRQAAGGPPYVLALGTAEPRKDFPGLVAAFDLIADRHPGLELRIAGPPGWGDAALDAAIAAAAHPGRVRRVGWVADPRPLLAGAEVLAYPSLYEGFGLPPLEAMAVGVPVVATSVGSLPEVLGDGAVLVPAADREALAGALDRVLADAGLRTELVAAGRRRAAAYSWDAAIDALVALYREVASTRSNTSA
jgi:glycosyltransferase involved in cell wall biosynthesis